jgi:hypothetical protein
MVVVAIAVVVVVIVAVAVNVVVTVDVIGIAVDPTIAVFGIVYLFNIRCGSSIHFCSSECYFSITSSLVFSL